MTIQEELGEIIFHHGNYIAEYYDIGHKHKENIDNEEALDQIKKLIDKYYTPKDDANLKYTAQEAFEKCEQAFERWVSDKVSLKRVSWRDYFMEAFGIKEDK